MTDTATHAAPLALARLTAETAAPDAAEMLRKTEAQMGFVPEMYRYMANDPAVLHGYLSLYNAFRTQSDFNAAEQEVVFLTISRLNGCHYCIAAHSMIADKGAALSAENLRALREGARLSDPRLDALAQFVAAMVAGRGNPAPAALAGFQDAGFLPRHALSVILAMACKTFSNSINHLAGTELDAAFRPWAMEGQER